jgi:hypothetical protein
MINHAQKLIEATEKYVPLYEKEILSNVIIEILKYLIDNTIRQDTWFVEEQDIEFIIKQLKENSFK